MLEQHRQDSCTHKGPKQVARTQMLTVFFFLHCVHQFRLQPTYLRTQQLRRQVSNPLFSPELTGHLTCVHNERRGTADGSHGNGTAVGFAAKLTAGRCNGRRNRGGRGGDTHLHSEDGRVARAGPSRTCTNRTSADTDQLTAGFTEVGDYGDARPSFLIRTMRIARPRRLWSPRASSDSGRAGHHPTTRKSIAAGHTAGNCTGSRRSSRAAKHLWALGSSARRTQNLVHQPSIYPPPTGSGTTRGTSQASRRKQCARRRSHRYRRSTIPTRDTVAP